MSMTYLELLQRVAEDTQPKKIRIMNKTYTWDGVDYTNEAGSSLAEDMGSWIVNAHAKADIIEEVVPILTEEETELLRWVDWISGYQIKTVQKIQFSQDDQFTCERLVVRYQDKIIGDTHQYLPNFLPGTVFNGMELNKKYTREELDL